MSLTNQRSFWSSMASAVFDLPTIWDWKLLPCGYAHVIGVHLVVQLPIRTRAAVRPSYSAERSIVEALRITN